MLRLFDAASFMPNPDSAATQDSEAPSFLRTLGAGIEKNWITASAARWARHSDIRSDPGFALTGELLSELGDGLPRQYWSAFADARSLEHAYAIRENMQDIADADRTLQEAGASGTAASIGAAVLDPVGLGVSVVAAPAAALNWASRGTRLARMAKFGLISGGTESIVEAGQTAEDPTAGADSIIYAGIGAGILGGSLGAFARPLGDVKKKIEYNDVRAAMGAAARGEFGDDLQQELLKRLSPKGQQYFGRVVSGEADAEALKHAVQHSGLDSVEDADLIEAVESAIDAGWRPRDVTEEVPAPVESPEDAVRSLPEDGGTQMPAGKQAGDLVLSDATDSRPFLGRLRVSFAAQIGRSRSADVRAAGTMMVEDALAKADGAPRVQSASQWVNETSRADMAQYYRVRDIAFREWMGEKNLALWKAFDIRTQEEFAGEVGLAMRRADRAASIGIPAGSPAVMKAAKAASEAFERTLSRSQRHLVRGADQITHSDSYLPVNWSPVALNNAVARFGMEAIEELFSDALVRGVSDIDADVAEKISKGMIRTIMRADQYDDVTRRALFEGGQADVLRAIIKEQAPELDDVAIDNILYRAVPDRAATDADRTPNLRHRVRLDHSTRSRVTDSETGDTVTLSIEHLIDNNVDRLVDRYVRSMNGASAAAEVYRTMGSRLGKEIDDFDGLRRELIDGLNSIGESRTRIDSQMRLLEMFDRSIRGMPIYDYREWHGHARRLRGWAYIVYSGGFGFAQLAEAGNTVAAGGVKSLFQQMPTMRNVWKRAQDGSMSEDVLDFIETQLGFGTDTMTSRFHSPYNPVNSIDESWKTGDALLAQGGKFAGYLSFMNQVNMALQRSTGLVTIQKMVNMAQAGRVPNSRRLAAVGMTEDQWNRLATAIRSELDDPDGAIKTVQGVLGRRVKTINAEAFKDQEALSRMIRGVSLWSRQAIQENSLGNLNQWLTNPLGQMILQFRTFHYVSYEKQLLHRLQTRDLESAMAVLYTTAFAGLAYTAQQYMASLGRADAQEFREERLSLDRIAAAAVQRSGWASVLPGVIETANTWSGGDPIFNARNTNLATGISAQSTPVGSMLMAPFGAIGDTIGLARDESESFTERDIRNYFRIAPFRNVTGLQNVYEALIGLAPDDD